MCVWNVLPLSLRVSFFQIHEALVFVKNEVFGVENFLQIVLNINFLYEYLKEDDYFFNFETHTHKHISIMCRDNKCIEFCQ